MSHAIPEDLSLGYGLVALCELTGARSGWLQKGPSLIDSNLSFAESRIEKMAEIVDEMATSYAQVDREMETAFFGFENHFILAVCERSLRVVLFFPAKDHDLSTLTDTITAARRFIRKNRPKILVTFEKTQAVFLKARERALSPSPTPVAPERPNPWPKIAPRLTEILSEAMSTSQAQSLIDRTLEYKGMPDGPNITEIAKVSREIFRRITIPAQREELVAKLEEILKEQRLV